MPLYEEKFVSPFAIRFSQARIRPTFQDGRLVERSMSQVEALPWPLEGSVGYDVFLSAPFPPIEIIRWRPKLREEDGRTLVDEDGTTILGEPCWFTFDNRRLYCLQAAAAKHWPRRSAAIVHVMHDLPLSRSTPRKFRTTDLGCSVRIARRHDPVPRATWCWAEATYGGGSGSRSLSEAGKAALDHVNADAAKEDWSELIDVPEDLEHRSVPATSSASQAQGSCMPKGHHQGGTNGHRLHDAEAHRAVITDDSTSASGAGGSRASSSSQYVASSVASGRKENRLESAPLTNGKPPGPLLPAATDFTSPPTGMNLLLPSSEAFAMAAPLLPSAGTSLLAGSQPSVLAGGQMLLASSADDDDDEGNCTQS